MAGTTALLLVAFFALTTAARFNVRGAQSSEPACERFANEVLNKLQQPEVAALALMGLNVGEMVQWATTIDINNRQQVQDVMCNVLGVDVAQAVDYLDTTGILEQMVRRSYDLDVAMYQRMKPMLQMAAQHDGVMPGIDRATAGIQVRIIELAESAGFGNLDPQGVAESQGYVAMVMAMAQQGGPGSPHKRSAMFHKRASTCEEAKGLFRELFATNNHHVASMRQMMGAVTGLNTQDPDFVGQFVCDVMTSSNIRGIVDIMRDHNIFTNALNFAMTYLRPQMQQAYMRFQSIESMDLSGMMDTQTAALAKGQAAQMVKLLSPLKEMGVF